MPFPLFSHDKNSADTGSLTGRPAEEEVLPGPESPDAIALARVINRAGMSGVALFALDVLKPLHWLGGQAVWMLQPFVDALGLGARGNGAFDSGKVARLLEREDGLDELASHIEEMSQRPEEREKSV
ncbi:MAG: hypothetical protein ABI670_03360 [Chloroflexota bacterium]